MKHWKNLSVCLLVLALLALPSLALFGCGGEGGEEGVVTIRVGYLTDMTGVAASAMRPNQWAIQDAWEYLEKNDPIPGVKLKLEPYDTQMNAARVIPGYEWLKERGVVAIYSFMPQNTDVIASFIAKDKMPALTHTSTAVSLASPWVFDSGLPAADEFRLSLKWLSDRWPNYPTKPKVGIVGWDTSYEQDIAPAMRNYCLAHPDKFEWVGAYLTPAGTMTWGGEIGALKGCDYIAPIHAGGTGQATFIAEFGAAGYKAKFFGGMSMPVWTDMILGKVGWEGMNGSFSCLTWPWWSYQNTSCAVARDALLRNHSGETQISLGFGYVSQVTAQFFWYNLLKAAIEKAGAENLDGQAIYDTAVNFRYTVDGMTEMGYTESQPVHVNTRYGMIWEWSAAARDIVPISDWLVVP